MRCSSESVTRRKSADRGCSPVDDEYRDRMTNYNDSGGKPHVTTAEVQFDARDVLAGHYDHVPIRVLNP